jgi:GNAT superfamily N-acetyltransferase
MQDYRKEGSVNKSVNNVNNVSHGKPPLAHTDTDTEDSSSGSSSDEREASLYTSPPIREYRPDTDHAAVLRIYREAFPGYTVPALTKRLASCRAWVSVNDCKGTGWGQVTGYVMLTDNYLEQIAVHASHRGQGVGTKLLKTAHMAARHTNDTVRLQVMCTNPARRLYRRMGYRATSHDPNMYGIGHPGVSMTLSFTNTTNTTT